MTVIEQSYRHVNAKLMVIALALFVVGTNAFVIAGLLPNIARDLHGTSAEVSYSITSYSILVAVAAPAASILFARMPRAILMAAGLAVFALGAAIAVSSTSLVEFFVGRTLSGLGGAALVPTATAAAASLARPERRARALAIVGAGFTLATAVGAPFGTALGGVAGWRTPMWILVAIGGVLAVLIPLTVRNVPIAPPVSLRRRLTPLRDVRVLNMLGTTMLMVAAFNVVYIFSAAVTAPATGGSGTLLAVLLLCYGVTGVVGNLLAGPLTDRFGSKRTAVLAITGQILALAAISVAGSSFVVDAIAFAVWGLAAFAMMIPVQHRLVTIEPASAAITLSWFSTAMYLGISFAPLLGTATQALGGSAAIPIIGALVSVIALLLLLAGHRPTAPDPSAHVAEYASVD